MNRNMIVVAAAAGALVISAGTAWALGTSGDPAATGASPASVASTSTTTFPTTSPTTSPTTLPAPSDTAGAARLSADDAARLVRQRLGGGVVHEVEQELEHGRLEWKVEITKDGVTYDIRVDARTAAVTRVDTDARGAADRSADDRGGHGDDPAGDDHGGRGGHGGGHGADDAPGDDHGGDR